MALYDNVWGYFSRAIDLILMMAAKKLAILVSAKKQLKLKYKNSCQQGIVLSLP